MTRWLEKQKARNSKWLATMEQFWHSLTTELCVVQIGPKAGLHGVVVFAHSINKIWFVSVRLIMGHPVFEFAIQRTLLNKLRHKNADNSPSINPRGVVGIHLPEKLVS